MITCCVFHKLLEGGAYLALDVPVENFLRMLGSELVNVLRPSLCVNWSLLKLGSYLPTKSGRWRYDLSCQLHVKGTAPRSSRVIFLSPKSGVRLGEDFLLEKSRERTTVVSFLK